MSGFSKREDAFENKFAFDAEKRFKAEARRNKMLAHWVGELAKMTPQQIADYIEKFRQYATYAAYNDAHDAQNNQGSQQGL